MSDVGDLVDATDDLLAVAHLLARVRLRRLAEEAANAPVDAGIGAIGQAAPTGDKGHG